jgi:hypothetical protein
MICAASMLVHVFQRLTAWWFLLFQPDLDRFLVDLVAIVVALGSVLGSVHDFAAADCVAHWMMISSTPA